MEIIPSLLSLPSLLSGTLVVAATILFAMATYFVARAVLHRRADHDARELAGSVIFRVSALHGLILALVFAEELVNHHQVERNVSHEAALLADVFYDLKRYEKDETRGLRTDLALYVGDVIEVEWPRLATEQRLSDKAWGRWVKVYEAILDLDPLNTRQQELKLFLLTKIREIPELRRERETAASRGVSPFFMAAAFIGVILTAASFFTFAPGTVNMLLLSVFGGYTGLVIYFIVVFANPYLEPGAIEPIGFQVLLSGEVLDLYRAAKGG